MSGPPSPPRDYAGEARRERMTDYQGRIEWTKEDLVETIEELKSKITSLTRELGAITEERDDLKELQEAERSTTDRALAGEVKSEAERDAALERAEKAEAKLQQIEDLDQVGFMGSRISELEGALKCVEWGGLNPQTCTDICPCCEEDKTTGHNSSYCLSAALHPSPTPTPTAEPGDEK